MKTTTERSQTLQLPVKDKNVNVCICSNYRSDKDKTFNNDKVAKS